MLKSKFFIKEGVFAGYELQGHAYHKDYPECIGNNLICGAISFFSQAIKLKISKAGSENKEIKSGHEIVMDDTGCNSLMISVFYDAVVMLQKQYPMALEEVVREGD